MLLFNILLLLLLPPPPSDGFLLAFLLLDLVVSFTPSLRLRLIVVLIKVLFVKLRIGSNIGLCCVVLLLSFKAQQDVVKSSFKSLMTELAQSEVSSSSLVFFKDEDENTTYSRGG